MEDKIEEGPLLLDYMSQMEHDTKFEDSPVGEAGEVFGEYTPFSFITYAEEKENWCRHEFSRLIDAPMKEVSEFFEEWNNIPPAFDLIDTVRLFPALHGFKASTGLLQQSTQHEFNTATLVRLTSHLLA